MKSRPPHLLRKEKVCKFQDNCPLSPDAVYISNSSADVGVLCSVTTRPGVLLLSPERVNLLRPLENVDVPVPWTDKFTAPLLSPGHSSFYVCV
jgi:hypothetical protein